MSMTNATRCDEIYLSTKYFPETKFKTGALEQSLTESMQRLGRKSADLFWIHKPNNLAENLTEAIPLMKDGRIRSIGISNVSMANIHEAEELLAKAGLKLGAVQNHFNLLRNDQQPIIDYCNSKGIRYYASSVYRADLLVSPLFSLRRRSVCADYGNTVSR